MKTLTLRIPPTLDAKLSAAAKRRNVAKSAVVREAIERYLERERKNTARGSFLEAARPWIGCVDSGVGDLSYNEKHLEGLGR